MTMRDVLDRLQEPDRGEALLAAVGSGKPVTGSVFATGTDYVVYLAPIGLFTGDDRIIFDLSWREGRLPFTYSDSEMSHGDAVHVGNLINFRYEEIDGLTWVVADLEWDTDEVALDARRMVDEDKIRGVSIRPGGGWAITFCRDGMSDTPTRDQVEAAAERAVDGEEITDCDRWAQAWFDVEVGAATMVLVPAFPDAHVEPLVAAAQEVADLMSPPREWFNDPGLDQPSGIEITAEGRVTGHIAFWDSCHRGFGECVLAPRNLAYTEFHKNAVMRFDDEELGVGCLTLDVHHADDTLNLDGARSHYDHSGTVFAFVRAGEDEHGVWVSGALAPGLDAEKVEVARRMRLSGDWRPLNGGYELIAAQSVPVPGFVPKTLVASGLTQTVGPEGSNLEGESDLALVASVLRSLNEAVEELVSYQREERSRRELETLFDSETSTP